jgi:hypothetical protein
MIIRLILLILIEVVEKVVILIIIPITDIIHVQPEIMVTAIVAIIIRLLIAIREIVQMLTLVPIVHGIGHQIIINRITVTQIVIVALRGAIIVVPIVHPLRLPHHGEVHHQEGVVLRVVQVEEVVVEVHAHRDSINKRLTLKALQRCTLRGFFTF